MREGIFGQRGPRQAGRQGPRGKKRGILFKEPRSKEMHEAILNKENAWCMWLAVAIKTWIGWLRGRGSATDTSNFRRGGLL